MHMYIFLQKMQGFVYKEGVFLFRFGKSKNSLVSKTAFCVLYLPAIMIVVAETKEDRVEAVHEGS